MMKTYRDLVDRARLEIEEEREELAVETLKERIKEIEAMEVVLVKMKEQYKQMLDKPIDGTLYLPEA